MMKVINVFIVINIIILFVIVSLTESQSSHSTQTGHYEQKYKVQTTRGGFSTVYHEMLLSPEEDFFYSQYSISDEHYDNMTFKISGRLDPEDNDLNLITDKISFSEDASKNEYVSKLLLNNNALFVSRVLLRYIEGSYELHQPSRYISIWNEDGVFCFYSNSNNTIECVRSI